MSERARLRRRSGVHAVWVGLAVLALAATGCVRRALTIRTNPPGAQVYLNDELIGVSPTRFDFQWYGWYRVILRKEGFARLDDRRLLRSPIHFWIPFDLIWDVVPFTIRDERTWSYTLQPAPELPTPRPPGTEPREPIEIPEEPTADATR